MQDICVIVPTIRNPECLLEYIENAKKHSFDLSRLHFVLITEDFCDTQKMTEMMESAGVSGEVFDETRRNRWMNEHGMEEQAHIIPRASHAETSFGLLYMWKHDYTYGFFIDDDTEPIQETDYFGTHMSNLEYRGEIPHVSSSNQWVNVLYQNHERHGLYPRGYPYSLMDEEVSITTKQSKEIVASQGLWTNIPDLDAVRILMDGDLDGQAETLTRQRDYTGDFVVDKDNYLTVCSMNLAFKREVIPAFYQLPMDDNPWEIGRFDDIWSGVFLKRACDVLDKNIINGFPLCAHNKAPRSTFKDLNNEVPGLELNEHLWEIIDDAGGDSSSFEEVFRAMAGRLIEYEPGRYVNDEFYNYVGRHMMEWLDCLDVLERVDVSVPDT